MVNPAYNAYFVRSAQAERLLSCVMYEYYVKRQTLTIGREKMAVVENFGMQQNTVQNLLICALSIFLNFCSVAISGAKYITNGQRPSVFPIHSPILIDVPQQL